MTIVNSSNDSNIMRVSSTIGIMNWESMVDLAKSVGIGIGFGIRVSVTLSIVAMDSMVGISMVSICSISSVSNGTIPRNTSMTIVNSSNDSNIMRVASSIGIVNWESMVDLAKSVGIGIRFSIRVSVTLSIVAMDSMLGISMVSICSIASVSNGTISGNTSMTIVNSSNDSNI